MLRNHHGTNAGQPASCDTRCDFLFRTLSFYSYSECFLNYTDHSISFQKAFIRSLYSWLSFPVEYFVDSYWTARGGLQQATTGGRHLGHLPPPEIFKTLHSSFDICSNFQRIKNKVYILIIFKKSYWNFSLT